MMWNSFGGGGGRVAWGEALIIPRNLSGIDPSSF